MSRPLQEPGRGRRLGRFELAWLHMDRFRPTNAVVVLRLRSAPGAALLRPILDAVQARRPLLRVGIAKRRGWRFQPGAPKVPLAMVERSSPDLWRTVAEDELAARLEPMGPLLQVSYVHRVDDPESELVLTFQHTIMDAVSAVELIDELLDSWATGTPSSVPPRPLPPPVEAFFPVLRRGLTGWLFDLAFMARQAVDEWRWRRSGAGAWRPPVREEGRSRVLTLELSRAETDALLSARHERGVPLTTLVDATLLTTLTAYLKERRQDLLGEDGAWRHLYFENVRRWLRQRWFGNWRGTLQQDDLVPSFAMMRVTIAPPPSAGDPSEDVWALARRLAEKVSATRRRGDHFSAMRLAPAMVKMMVGGSQGRMATTALSFTSSLKLRQNYGETELERLHAFVSVNGICPLYSGNFRLLHGRLLWDVVYLDTDFDRGSAAEIVRRLRVRLLALGGLRSSTGP